MYPTLLQADPEVVDQLRSDMQSLLTEVSDLSRRNDEIMQARDQDLVVIQDLNAQIKEYKRKYELAKTELRNVKGASSISVGPTFLFADEIRSSYIPAFPADTKAR